MTMKNRESRQAPSRSATAVETDQPSATFQVKRDNNKVTIGLDPHIPPHHVSLIDGDIHILWEHSSQPKASLSFVKADSQIKQFAGLQLGLLDGELTERSTTIHFACSCDTAKQTMDFELHEPTFVVPSIVYTMNLFVLDSSATLLRHDPKIYNQGPGANR